MPLLILGIILLIGILIYSIIRYVNSGEEDPRSVRERYPHAFPQRKHYSDDYDDEGHTDNPLVRIFRNEGRPDIERPYYDAAQEERRKRENGENTIEFPTDNVEAEKIKRNIH